MSYNQFLIIPSNILSDKALNTTEKIIYAYIVGVWKSNLTFNASNNKMSKYLGLSRRQVIRTIESLTSKGYIRVYQDINSRIIYKPNTTNLDEIDQLIHKLVKR